MKKIKNLLQKLEIRYQEAREDRCYLLLNSGAPPNMYMHNSNTHSSSTRSSLCSHCVNGCDADCELECDIICDHECVVKCKPNCDNVFAINTAISRLTDTIN